MWSAPNQPIQQQYYDREHMKVLEDAVNECEQDYDVRSKAVYEALDYFQERTDRTWGFTLFREGLEDWNPKALHDGLKLIKQHIGKED